MGHHVKEYFCQSSNDAPRGNFHKVIALHDSPHVRWESISQLAPDLCKGWYELARLNPRDRIQFTHDFWLSKLPYHPKFDTFLANFFDSLEEIGVFIVQKKFDDPYQTNLVYSLKGDVGFFRGALPVSEEEILNIEKTFPSFILPSDYLAFLRIHNGFCKATDCTGITPSTQVKDLYQNFQALIQQEGPVTTTKGTIIDPKTLIPFYESFGMPFFQCFWAEWYPEQEMGNVYYSGLTKSISDVESSDSPSETMAFPTFTDWLMFYMEQIE